MHLYAGFMTAMPANRRAELDSSSSSPAAIVRTPPPRPSPLTPFRRPFYTMFWYRCSILEPTDRDETAYRGDELAVVALTALRSSSVVAMPGRHPVKWPTPSRFRQAYRQTSASHSRFRAFLKRRPTPEPVRVHLRARVGALVGRAGRGQQPSEGPTKLESLGDILRSKLTA